MLCEIASLIYIAVEIEEFSEKLKLVHISGIWI